jgi:hypothetical protein
MFKKLNITCKQAVAICDKSQYKEATFFEKIQLNIHFLCCKICTKYSKQNVFLTNLCRNKSNDDKKKQISLCMTPDEKEFLKKEIKKRYVRE